MLKYGELSGKTLKANTRNYGIQSSQFSNGEMVCGQVYVIIRFTELAEEMGLEVKSQTAGPIVAICF